MYCFWDSIDLWRIRMDWMKVAEDQVNNRMRVSLFIGIPGMLVIVFGGGTVYAAAAGVAKLLGF
ncbi:MAG: hypothetical protein KA066_02440 [Candidatus Pacebacteria bacterium]|nr:hypothetical protein [Candidatus Paceibacterota bacterium]